MNRHYIYKKELDWSTFNHGMAIPYRMQDIFLTTLTNKLEVGERKEIKILIETEVFSVNLKNYNVDRVKRPNAKKMVHLSYTKNTPLAKFLQGYFCDIFSYLTMAKETQTQKKKQIAIPEELLGYIYIYETTVADTYIFDCVNHVELEKEHSDTHFSDELELENLLNKEGENGDLESHVSKIRRRDIIVSRQLKEAYHYSCQICGERTGENYGFKIAEAHHIEPYSQTLNNNPENIVILCPNHHKVLHRAKPQYDVEKKLFLFPNGYTEGLALNKHL